MNDGVYPLANNCPPIGVLTKKISRTDNRFDAFMARKLLLLPITNHRSNPKSAIDQGSEHWAADKAGCASQQDGASHAISS